MHTYVHITDTFPFKYFDNSMIAPQGRSHDLRQLQDGNPGKHLRNILERQFKQEN